MTEPRDMDAPVTRRELHEALDLWSGTINAHTASMIADSEKRMYSQTSGLIANVIAESEKRVLGAVQLMFETWEQRLLYELRSQTKSSETELATRLVAVDDQYKDLPARVTRLEAKVFTPAKRKRRRITRSR